MSFSSKVKAELCRIQPTCACCARSELYGSLLYAAQFSHKEIRVAAENAQIIRRVQLLCKRVLDTMPEMQDVGKKKQIRFEGEKQIRPIFALFSYDYKSHVTYHINRNVLECEGCETAFLRGVFLQTGSVAEPSKKGHLELKAGSQSLAGEVMSLMLDMGLRPKETVRQMNHILYIKESTQIEDFLTLLGATGAAMELMEAKVEKNLRNTINRQVNCETANLVKATDAAARQVLAIHKLDKQYGLDALAPPLQETARLRLQYETDTLAELAARFDPPISKAGLSHRLKKITSLAEEEE